MLLLLLICLAGAPIIYAVSTFLANIRGGTIEIVGLSAGMSYSTDGVSWTALGSGITNVPLGTTIYARIETTAVGYAGGISITWRLFFNAMEIYTMADYTTATLSGATGDIIYCSPTGINSSLADFSTVMSDFGSYEIEASVYST